MTGVGATSVMPFGGSWSTGSFEIEGYTAPENQPGPWGDIRVVSAAVLRGDADSAAPRPLPQRRGPEPTRARWRVIDQEFVRRYYPKENPIGKRFTFGPPDGVTDTTQNEWIEVVGVVGHTAHEGLDADPRLQLYLSYRQATRPFMAVAVRTTGQPRPVRQPGPRRRSARWTPTSRSRE